MWPTETAAYFCTIFLSVDAYLERGVINPVHRTYWQKKDPLMLALKSKTTVVVRKRLLPL